MSDLTTCQGRGPTRLPPPGQRKGLRITQPLVTNSRAPRQVELEQVLGITVSSNSSITYDPNTGLIAYPAGCVIVLLCPRRNKQTHIFNTSRKPLSALSFSPDGKFIVTGDSGHKPAVRIWDVAEKVQVAEMLGHKYGVSCVCFSPNMKYVVSVGYQHDMVVNVWDWKINNIVAKNKVSSKVTAVSFSEDSSYFVTVGSRHVKFWYLETPKKLQINGTVPLVGRSGLLGDLHDNVFCGVACGKGGNSGSTFCISHSGVLCQFDAKRVLEKWIKLKVPLSNCLSVTEKFVFCGCVEGIVRIFNARNLQYITDLPKPHYLGVDIAQGLDPSMLFTKKTNSSFPDTTALVYDECKKWLCCVYNDHSLYVWDVNDTKKVGKVFSALYHSSYVWNVEVYPEVEEKPCQPSGSFLTCSSDNTIRLWNTERSSVPCLKRNIYSNDLQKVIYVDNNIQHLKDVTVTIEKSDVRDVKSGVRVITICPDGQHLASGDRGGNIRIYDLKIFDELVSIEAHEGEVLCLEYAKPETGVTLLASASRDRLIHVLNVENNYVLEQTLDDHSSSITAVKFAGDREQMHMISCGADKSIYFRPAQVFPDRVHFTRMHHVVEKTSLYDMDVDMTRRTVAVACQDKNIRLYNVLTGKQERSLKSSPGGGALLKVQMDPSGTFLATSCSDKIISIFDFQTGECIAVIFGHSDIVTDMKFTYDCKRFITVSGDSCVFIWLLDPVMTACMQHRFDEMAPLEKHKIATDGESTVNIWSETYIAEFEDTSQNGNLSTDKSSESGEISAQTPQKNSFEEDPTFLQTNGKLPLWMKKLDGDRETGLQVNSRHNYQPRGRWAQCDTNNLMRNILETQDRRSAWTPYPGTAENSFLHDQTALEDVEPKNLEHLLATEDLNHEYLFSRTFMDERSTVLEDSEGNSDSSQPNGGIIYPSALQISHPEESDFSVEEHHRFQDGFEMGDANINNFLSSSQDGDEDSRTSECGSEAESADLDRNNLQTSSLSQTPEQEGFLMKHFDTLIDSFTEEKFDNSLKDVKPSEDSDEDLFLNSRLSISARFLSRCQKNSRLANSVLPCSQQMSATDTMVEREEEQLSNSRKSTEKPVNDKTERREKVKSMETDSSIFQKLRDSETAAKRFTFPGCLNKDNTLSKTSKGRSYMEATASSKAKIFRCVSMEENMNTTQAVDQKRLSNLVRPVSSIDLYFLEQNKSQFAEDNACKLLLSSRTSEQMPSSGNQEAKAKSALGISSTLSDNMLMPPPSTCGIIPRLKKKAKSVNNLSKLLGREEKNSIAEVLTNKCGETTKREVTTGNIILDSQDFAQRLSPSAFPTHAYPSHQIDVPQNPDREDQFTFNVSHMSEPGAVPSPSNINASSVLLSKCEVMIEEFHSAFQKTLQLYNEIECSEGSFEEKLQMKTLFSEAFDHIRSEMDLVGSAQSTSTACNHRIPLIREQGMSNPTLHLLEHYSEMLLKLMTEKIDSK
ncbi:WD repeat-containing protein 62 isoform X1 [Ascaphus truei]|uniref:WD repeat-containing protein 62 isoform X1 n=1 Tax=Ascaphus truei TaxID=8439 RepID=UPI003F590690